MHRCGIFEAAIDAFLSKYELAKTEEFKKLSRKGWVTLNNKITLLNNHCLGVEEKVSGIEELGKAQNILRGIEKYKRPNGVSDLRNAIAHNPIIISIMGVWHPGLGYQKKYPDTVKISSGEIVEVLTTWSFSEIEELSNELLVIFSEMGFMPRDPL
jgi:hypothetical protein